MIVLATSMPVTLTREEVDGKNLGSNLVQVPYICYPINFGRKSVLVLLDSDSEVNAVHLVFAKELGLLLSLTDVRA